MEILCQYLDLNGPAPGILGEDPGGVLRPSPDLGLLGLPDLPLDPDLDILDLYLSPSGVLGLLPLPGLDGYSSGGGVLDLGGGDRDIDLPLS